MFPLNLLKSSTQLLLDSINCLILFFYKLGYFVWLMSPKSSSQLIPLLTGRQSCCSSPNSVVYPIGKSERKILVCHRICIKTYSIRFFTMKAQWNSPINFLRNKKVAKTPWYKYCVYINFKSVKDASFLQGKYGQRKWLKKSVYVILISKMDLIFCVAGKNPWKHT